jgi:hypothetical protein
VVKSKRQKRREREPEAQTVSVIRAICVERSKWKCEACGRGEWDQPNGWFAPMEMDHMWSRSREESVESCWMLCGGPQGCHRQKTDNKPSRLFWVRKFGIHCALHGYTKQLAKCRAQEESLLLKSQLPFESSKGKSK